MTKEDFDTRSMQDRVIAYHVSLEEHIGSGLGCENVEDDNDFTKDDVALPVGYEKENEGEYFGPEGIPDIDETIDTENARTEADSHDKFVGAEILLPNRGDLTLMAKVKRKVKSDDRNSPNFYNSLRDHSVYEIQFPDGTTDEVEANFGV